MAVTEETKLEIVQRLLVTKQKAHSLEILLRFKGKGDQADDVAASAAELSNQIDALLGQIIDEWLAQSTEIVADLKKANETLQRSVTAIKKGVQTAQNIVKAIGIIDDAAALAGKVISVVS